MNIALILSGGMGSRMGSDIPKQYIEINGKPIISYSLEPFFNHENIDKLQIVAEEKWHELILSYINKENKDKLAGFSRPGENRQLSILNGLSDIRNYAGDFDKIIIHDAARPLVSKKLISECISSLDEYEGVMPFLPMKDTVYEGQNGKISALLDRNKIIAGQAPEGFILGKYYQANLDLLPDKIHNINGASEPAVLAGMNVAYISGEERNFKITTKADLERFETIFLSSFKHA